MLQIASLLHCQCTHIYHVSLTKYGCHLASMCHTAIMLYGHIDSTSLHACAKTQPTAISTLHIIVMHVPETNITLKYHVEAQYADKFMCRYDTTCQYMSNMNSLQSIFHIIGICPCPNMPATLHMYAPLDCYCTLHTDTISMHKSVKE